MKFSNFYLPLLKEKPSDSSIISYELIIRAGLVRQISQGLYTILPLGMRVLHKIEKIIRTELEKINSHELIMPTIQNSDLWIESGRYSDYGEEMLKITDRHGKSLLYGPTNEEVVTHIFRTDIVSYKSLPINLYQIQWKFRDEIRPRFGLMRAREFLMMDAYSFDLDQESATTTYNKYYKAYLEIFKKMGLFVIPFRAASGAIGGNMSHEFQIISDNGESVVFYDNEFEKINIDDYPIDYLQKLYAKTEDEHNCKSVSNIVKKKGIEIGHIFYFGTKYSKSMNVRVMNKNGEYFYPEMGSYGIGVTRLLQATIEASHDKNGIIWPKQISPFDIILLNLDNDNEKCNHTSETIYDFFIKNNIEILYDDSNSSSGQKFSSADMIGIPYQIIIGKRSIENNFVEIKCRKTMQKKNISIDDVFTSVKLDRFF